jgi:hypothetical protein
MGKDDFISADWDSQVGEMVMSSLLTKIPRNGKR